MSAKDLEYVYNFNRNKNDNTWISTSANLVKPEIKAVLFRLLRIIVFTYKSQQIFTDSENQNVELSERSK